MKDEVNPWHPAAPEDVMDWVVERFLVRPAMYLPGGTFGEVIAYLSGYDHASGDSLLKEEGGFEAFGSWAIARLGFPDKYVWPPFLRRSCKDDDEAIARFRELLIEFRSKARVTPLEEMIQAERDAQPEEGPPEKALRAFLTALGTSGRDEIEPLILPHPDAEVLWAGAYPDGVGAQLAWMSVSQPFGRVGAGDDSRVEFFTADFPFPIRVELVEGKWLVDASEIIRVRRQAR